jgi:F-type H+-transporting ATPase subunit delta
VSNIAISRIYAKALMGIGKEDGKFAQYAEELNAFTGVLNDNPQFMDALGNPLYPLASRKKALTAILAKIDFSPVVKHFITLLMDKNRIGYLKDICASYQHLVDEHSNISSAVITSATELPEEVVEQIKHAVEKMTKKQVRLQLKVDPGIIGGIITKVGDMNFDGSVRTQLKTLKETLKRGE